MTQQFLSNHLTGTTNPTGVVEPQFVGQNFINTTDMSIWQAASLLSADWFVLSVTSGGGAPSYQDMQVAWTPTNLKLGEGTLFLYYTPVPGWTNGTFNQATTISGFDIEQQADLITLSFPNLISIDPTGVNGGYIEIFSNTALTSVAFPLFVTLSMASTNGFYIASNPVLTTISVPSFVPQNGAIVKFTANALLAASVNQILARCVANPAYVSGTVDVSGGTNAAPTGQGITDAATLVGRGVTVTTN